MPNSRKCKAGWGCRELTRNDIIERAASSVMRMRLRNRNKIVREALRCQTISNFENMAEFKKFNTVLNR